MELGIGNSQSHVAQQSRRDKLRIQQSTHQPEDYSSTMDNLNPNHSQISNVRYGHISLDPSLLSSDMHNFITNNSHVLSAHKDMTKVYDNQQNSLPWRSHDWVENYSGGVTIGIQGNQNDYTTRVGPMSVTKAYDLSSPLYRDPNLDGYQDVNPSNFTNPSIDASSQNIQKHYKDMQPPPFYQNALTVVSTPGTSGTQRLELASNINGSQIHNWNREWRSTIASDSFTQGLSLSLSPVHLKKTHPYQLPEHVVYPMENLTSEYITSKPKPTVVGSSSKVFGNTGPLGPFTGYASVLNSSKFLRPAEQLLEDICLVNASKSPQICEVSKKQISNEDNGFGYDIDESRVSSPKFYGFRDNSGEVNVRSSVIESFQPEYQQKRTRLLIMQDEVSRRHKQYHQQMEMVVSSFESVAGLSAATPCISLAIKAISTHFHSLKNAISDQLKYIRKLLGENFPKCDASTSTKGDASSLRLNSIEPVRLMKNKIGGDNLGFSEPQRPHAWRPQRGLPERSVAVLRAWLFDHFLHPYPTDTDKRILASQTGLSRDQVSNWFINARVRVWKPMVEEVHSLETKALSNSNPEGASTTDLHATSSKKAAEDQHNSDRFNRAMEKRSRTEYQVPTSTADTSFVGFMPYQGNGLGLEPVSLTLGLRQNPEEMGTQQQYQQQGQRHFGGQMVHYDFVG